METNTNTKAAETVQTTSNPAVAQERLVRRSSTACKHGDYGCGQYYDCGKCAREKRAAAYKRLTPKQKAYDRMIDPLGAYHTDFPQGCSCHICAPCSFCVLMTEEEPDAYAKSFSSTNA
jgi:hypothetical protein